MKKFFTKFLFVCMMMFTLSSMTSCYFVNPSYDEEVALKKTPWFFGSTGVDDDPVTSMTMYCQTTSAVTFKMLPQKYDFKFDDLLSNDNTPLDVSMYMVVQIQRGGTPELLRNYGENWYSTFIEPYFKNKVREFVSAYSPFDLMSNREVLKEFDANVQKSMQEYVTQLSKKKRFPIEIQSVITDRVMPNEQQLSEMNKTAAAIQQRKTQEVQVSVQEARARAENARAIADKAYMEQMRLNPDQYIQLKWIETVANKKDANIDVMVGPATSMWNVKR